jgi:hypothetical protein
VVLRGIGLLRRRRSWLLLCRCLLLWRSRWDLSEPLREWSVADDLRIGLLRLAHEHLAGSRCRLILDGKVGMNGTSAA